MQILPCQYSLTPPFGRYHNLKWFLLPARRFSIFVLGWFSHYSWQNFSSTEVCLGHLTCTTCWRPTHRSHKISTPMFNSWQGVFFSFIKCCSFFSHLEIFQKPLAFQNASGFVRCCFAYIFMNFPAYPCRKLSLRASLFFLILSCLPQVSLTAIS